MTDRNREDIEQGADYHPISVRNRQHLNTGDKVLILEENGRVLVYTIEGNSGDALKQNYYPVVSASILGFGILN